MAELVNDLCASGKRTYKPGKAQEVTDKQASIPIDPILLAESITQQKLYLLDMDSDSDVHSLYLVSYLN